MATIDAFKTWAAANRRDLSAADVTAVTDLFNAADIARANLIQIFIVSYPRLPDAIREFLKRDSTDGQNVQHEG